MTAPLYLEIKAALELKILSGRAPSGQKLPSIRVLADRRHVNGNTVQRALAELRKTGLVTSRCGKALRVVSDTEQIIRRRQEKASAAVRNCIRQRKHLGHTREEIKTLIFAGI